MTHRAICSICCGVLLGFLLIPLSAPAKRPATAPERDNPLRRELWFSAGRKFHGHNGAARLYRAYRQKIAMRVRRREAMRATQSTPSITQLWASTLWSPLGPAPLSSNATGLAADQDYGPVTGRVSALAVDPNDATGNTVYIAGAYGGVWKSTNAARSDPASVTWSPLTDDEATLATGALAVQPGNGNVVLAGTGEPNSAIDSYYGLGILRSSDAGGSWNLITAADNGASPFTGMGFSKIAFNSENSNIVVAGASSFTIFQFISGAIQGTGGLFYSLDAGASWHSATVADPSGPTAQTGVTDIVYSRTTHRFYAAMAFHGFYSSPDGVNWTRLAAQPGDAILDAATCPPSPFFSGCAIFRGALAVNPAAGDLYAWYVSFNGNALVDHGIYKSVNGGASWSKLNQAGMNNCGDGGIANGCGASEQGWYNLELLAVPNGSATDLWAGAVNLFRCTITSANPLCGVNPFLNLTHVYGCTPVGAPAHVHPDEHGIGFALVNGRAAIYFGNDGGVYRTLNGFDAHFNGSCGAGSDPFENLNANMGSLTQFTGIALHPNDPSSILGGTQDNGSPAVDDTHSGARGTSWLSVNGGDGGFSAINPTSPNEWFTYVPEPAIYRCTSGINCLAQNFQKVVGSDAPTDLGGDSASFYMPYMLDSAASGRMIAGTCRVWRGNKDGSGFSPLSYNFASGSSTVCNLGDTLISALATGGPVTSRGSQVVYAGTGGEFSCGGLFAPLCEVWVTTAADSGPASWARRLTTQVPISDIAVDPTDTAGATAYVAVMGFGVAHVLKTTTAGRTWTDISANLPDAPADAIVVDPRDPNTIYVGTDVGVFATMDAGSSWTELGPATGSGHLPNVAVTSLKLFDSNGTRLLRAGTHGRGVWEFALALPPPDYQIRLSNPTLSLVRGGSLRFTGSLKALNGYTSAVTVSCSGSSVPSTCSPATVTPGGGTGTPFSINVASSSPGTFNFNLQAVGVDSNTVTHLLAVTVQVADLTLIAGPSAVTVNRGSSSDEASVSMVLSGVPGFTSTLSLSCGGLPAALQCSFFPTTPVTVTTEEAYQGELTIAASASALAGTYPITVTAGGPGGATRSQVLQVTVNTNADYAVELQKPTLTGSPGNQVSSTLSLTPANGYTGTVSASCSAPVFSRCAVQPSSAKLASSAQVVTMTATIGSSAMPGKYAGVLVTSDALSQLGHNVPFAVAVTDFSFSASAARLAVTRGHTGNLTFSVSPVGGAFDSAIQFSCSGLPAQSSCSFSPSSVTPGNGSAGVTMSVTTTATIAALRAPGTGLLAMWTGFPIAAFLFSGRARPRSRLLCRFVSLGFLLLVLASCGGGGGGASSAGPTPLPGTPAGTYTLTVKAMSGSLVHSTPVKLVVQ
jgi:hypothetical protein